MLLEFVSFLNAALKDYQLSVRPLIDQPGGPPIASQTARNVCIPSDCGVAVARTVLPLSGSKHFSL